MALLGAVAGCHCSVLWLSGRGAIAGCHCRAPLQGAVDVVHDLANPATKRETLRP